jgi:hypothetical protein
LQSDIDLARRLIAAGESDAQIIVALGYRRIGVEKAHRVVRDLRRGIDVPPDPLPDISVEAPPRATGPVDEQDAASQAECTGASNAPKKSQRAAGFSWLRLAFLAVVGVSLAAVFLVNHNSKPTARATPSEQLMVRPEPNLRRHHLEIEVEPPNVRVGGTTLSRENALKTLSGLVGVPARTNQIADVRIYAFDQSGILLYSEAESGKQSLLVYFQAVGGANGAQNAFSGSLAIRGNGVTVTTGSRSLTAIPELALSETAPNVFSGKCEGLGLSFAYLKTPDHLSLVQIDLQ